MNEFLKKYGPWMLAMVPWIIMSITFIFGKTDAPPPAPPPLPMVVIHDITSPERKTFVKFEDDSIVTGVVGWYSSSPGRGDMLIEPLAIDGKRGQTRFLRNDGKITFDGVVVTMPELYAMFYSTRHEYEVHFVFHPRIDRYGAISDAEFTTVKTK